MIEIKIEAGKPPKIKIKGDWPTVKSELHILVKEVNDMADDMVGVSNHVYTGKTDPTEQPAKQKKYNTEEDRIRHGH